MGTEWRLAFGAGVQLSDLEAVLREFGARRQEEFMQWWACREVPRGGFWLYDPSPTDGGPESHFWLRLCGSMPDSRMVAAQFACLCGVRWPCTAYENSSDLVLSESVLAIMAAHPPQAIVDLAFGVIVTERELAAVVIEASGAPWDLEEKETGSVWLTQPGVWVLVTIVYDPWCQSTREEIARRLGRPCQSALAVHIDAEAGAADLMQTALSLIRERWPCLVVQNSDEQVLPVEVWQEKLRQLWTWK